MADEIEPTPEEQEPGQTPRPTPNGNRVTRRRFIAGGLAVGAAAGLSAARGDLIERAFAATAPSKPALSDIEHVVILMQENRSFDHYFGTLSGVSGFADPAVLSRIVDGRSHAVFDQFGYAPGIGPSATGFLQPFHLQSDPPKENGETTNDIDHSWAPQHQSWDHGAMEAFIEAHLAADGAANGPVTMGYLTRADLAFYYALADAFTICDHYHCSVLGPTDPNRVMAMSATLDPTGSAGGPVVETFSNRVAEYGKLQWTTMPERLLEAGVSWKVYHDPLSLLALSPLPYFKAYSDPFHASWLALNERATRPSYPGTFESDVRSGHLPSVSWIIPPLAECEHPAAPPEFGEYLVQQVLSTLVSNPEVWAKTVLFITWDENGGFFDHVAPPTAPDGTGGEWLTAASLPSAAGEIRGPVGLGFRVPCLVISPFSRGGFASSEVFDHTSLLRFIEIRFGVTVPNLSSWRRSVTGDMTAALALSQPPETSVPPLPAVSLGETSVAEQAVLNALAGTLDVGIPYPIPTANAMPTQETTPARPPVP